MRILKWARVVDSHDGRLSLTALSFFGSVAYLLAVGGWQGVATFAVASALYAHRRILVHRSDDRALEISALRADLQRALESIHALQDKEGKHDSRIAAVENRPRVR